MNPLLNLSNDFDKPPEMTSNPTYAIHWHRGNHITMEIVPANGYRIMRFRIGKQLMVDLLAESKNNDGRFEFYNRDSHYQQIRVFEREVVHV